MIKNSKIGQRYINSVMDYSQERAKDELLGQYVM